MNLALSTKSVPFSLVGMAVMSGVAVVAEFSRQREANGNGVKEAVIQGSLKQMRPVFMMVIRSTCSATTRRMSGRTASSGESPCEF